MTATPRDPLVCVCLQPGTNHLMICEMDSKRIQVLSYGSEEQTKQLSGPTKRHQSQPPSQLQRLYSVALAGILAEEHLEDSNLTSICCRSNGDIFVTDAGLHQIYLFDCKGRFCTTLKGPHHQLQSPSCVFVNPPPNQPLWRSILVADWKRISVWDDSMATSSIAPKYITSFPVDNPLSVWMDLNSKA